MAIWSAARIAWSLTLLLYFKNGVQTLYEGGGDKNLPSIIMFLLLLFCEIVPIFILIDLSFLRIIGFQSQAASEDMDSHTDDELSQRLVTERMPIRPHPVEEEKDSDVRGLDSTAVHLYGEYTNTVREKPLVR